MNAGAAKPRIAVHKFSSCDGCQLAFLNAGARLLDLAERVEIAHFAEAGVVDELADVDIAFVEGSISTAHDAERIQAVRAHCRYLVTIGACATAGGLQALRNFASAPEWAGAIYARPEFIDTLERVTPIRAHVRVDWELWGCPVDMRQVLAATADLLGGIEPRPDRDQVCIACKRSGAVCVLVARGGACLGPVTRTGCGALCPRFGRECYGCYGPGEAVNTQALAVRFEGLGLAPDAVQRRFRHINSQAEAFLEAGRRYERKP